MKNLMIAAALSLGTMTAFAQEAETAVEETETAVEETATDATDAATEAAEDTYGAAEDGAQEVGDAAEDAYDAAEDGAEEAGETMEEAGDAAEEATSQDNFSEVALEEVPEAITTALEEAHPGATVDKAHMNEQAQYKLEVTKEDGETAELYMDAEGNMIEM